MSGRTSSGLYWLCGATLTLLSIKTAAKGSGGGKTLSHYPGRMLSLASISTTSLPWSLQKDKGSTGSTSLHQPEAQPAQLQGAAAL